jgi:hypothetical protein
MPMSQRGMALAGAAPQAWFQSWLGLNRSSHASRLIVDPTSIMCAQPRSAVEVRSASA